MDNEGEGGKPTTNPAANLAIPLPARSVRPPRVLASSSGAPSLSSPLPTAISSPRPSPLGQSHILAGSSARNSAAFGSYSPVSSERRASLSSTPSSESTEVTSVEGSTGDKDFASGLEGEESAVSVTSSAVSTGEGSSGSTKRALSGTTSLLRPQSSTTSSETLATTSNAINIPLQLGSIPISISSPVLAGVRLSTTPLFPSPLAQASGPEEDIEHLKSDGESEEELDTSWVKGRDQMERQNSALFGELDMSPNLETMLLPDSNSLGLEPAVSSSPRPARQHSRQGSVGDRSPEAENGRQARLTRARSFGRANGLAISNGSGRSPEQASGSGLGRRASRSSESGALVEHGYFMSSTRSIPPFLSPSPPNTSSAPTASLSRRSSINLNSPGRSSSSSSRLLSPRSSLSVALATSIPAPYPAAPPPVESIKLQKVPEAVRSAMDFRLPSGTSFSGESASLTPKTPAATRVPSPASGSGSGTESVVSDTVRSLPFSQDSSRQASRRSSRPSSRERVATSPITSPVHIPGHNHSTSNASSSAFSPLTPFPSSPSSGPSVRGRERSTSVYLPTTPGYPASAELFRDLHAARTASDSEVTGYEAGVSPLYLSTDPFGHYETDPVDLRASTSVAERGPARSDLVTRRTLMAPTGVGSAGGTVGDTDEYAHIILASRTAKMRKWKTSTSTLGTAGLDLTFLGGKDGGLSRSGIPSFDNDVDPLDEMDITQESLVYGTGSSGNKEIEWVDWLDEYRKMKEAKMRAEQGESMGDLIEQDEPLSPAIDLKGKGKAGEEYNPFEATTEHINRKTTAFLSAGLTAPHSITSLLTPSFPFAPKSTSVPIPPRSAYVASSSPPSLNFSPTGFALSASSAGGKRKRNFKLGPKIDAWWSAVRTSFNVGSEEEKEKARRLSDGTPPRFDPSAAGAPRARTSSQTTRPSTPSLSVANLRNSASAHNLQQAISGNRPFVPTGALAPATRVDAFGHPRLKARSSSNDAPERRRNPNLSLHLGPSFSTPLQPKSSAELPKPPLRPVSLPITKATSPESFEKPSPWESLHSKSSSFSSPPLSSPLRQSTGFTPGITAGLPPIWDKTPGLVPTSTADFRAAVTAAPIPKPREPKAKANADASFSMQNVRLHIKNRLAAAKENCDKELKKIIQSITTHVENELHKFEAPRYDETQFGDLVGDVDGPYGPYPTYAYGSTVDLDSESEALADDLHDEGHTDSEGATSRPESRSRQRGRGSPTLGPAAPVRKPSVTNRVRSGPPRRQSLVQRSRRLTTSARHPELSSYSFGDVVNSVSTSESASSSRSNSRNRPTVPLNSTLGVASTGSRSPARSHHSASPLTGDLAQSAFIVLLQEISTIATEILDTPISKLTSGTGGCAEYIQRVQQIGKAWDENPELSFRGWYVQLLLAVAGLSRVVEWWEAERGFWTFDEVDEEDTEPILFVANPTTEEEAEALAIAAATTQADSSVKYTPVESDVGENRFDDSEDAMQPLPPSSLPLAADATKQDAEDLRQAVEQVRSQTLLMELSLDGQLFQYLSSAWQDLVGLDGADCLETPISDFLYPDDAAVFAEATRQLEADDSHTVEVSFRLRVASSSASSQDDQAEDLYEVMEGKGMLMLDGLSGGPSHTMWVIRPAPYVEEPQDELDLDQANLDAPDLFFQRREPLRPAAIAPTFSAEPILCRICERPSPAWFFEKHNETCNETHRLESDINECNERLKDISTTVSSLVASVEEVEGPTLIEYRGIPLVVPPSSPSIPTYLEGLKSPLSGRPQALQIRKQQRRILDQVADILQTALAISIPSVLDEEVPIQEQRLLSPNSENKLALVMRWQRPISDDPALVRLIADTEEQTRFKLNSVNRLRNTILYAEKVRQEWEAKANASLAVETQNAPPAGLAPPFDSPLLQPIKSDESPLLSEKLELPTAALAFRRHSAHLFDKPAIGSSADLARSPLSPGSSQSPLSPRIPSGVPSSRTKESSIKDFTILKPISKGAFGSVYLAKKITTGDYYAIKVLKKADMVAKNQVTNVKAERMILMSQTESDFVVKLYYTFQSKDYLYLVMEYLNGGDCAALIKAMGELPEDWTRKYIAEVVVGLEYLHASGIVHRDLKPDNLLIDASGHLKLTDFGLSRIGLLGRQTRMPVSRNRGAFEGIGRASPKIDASQSSSPSSTPGNALGASPLSYFGGVVNDSFSLDTPNSDSSGSGHANPSHKHIAAAVDAIVTSQASDITNLGRSEGPASQKNFVGTPDYLAPESILGIGMDARVDWWALGVICYEFLYGIPPFHDDTPEKVFENILSRKIEWHEDVIDLSPEARDFIERLLCTDSSRRLGAGGASEVKAHPFFAGIDWHNLLKGEVEFVPVNNDPESTDYFDPRGATAQVFSDQDVINEDEGLRTSPPKRSHATSDPLMLPPRRENRMRSVTEPAVAAQEDFGAFSFRNLPVLKQANDDVIRKMRDEQLLPPLTLQDGPSKPLAFAKMSKSRAGSVEFRGAMSIPSSPSTATSSSSYPSRPSIPTSFGTGSNSHSRRPSEQQQPSALDRLRRRQSSVGDTLSEVSRRNSLPTRLRRGSVSEIESSPPLPEAWGRRRTSAQTPPTSQLSSPSLAHQQLPPLAIPTHPSLAASHSAQSSSSAHRANTIDCLVAGRNPISNKVLETMLVRMGCRCVVVPDGAEAILAAGGVKFDIIWMDLQMPVVDGEKAARMIKSTKNPSSACPIVAVCSYGTNIDDEVGTLFSGVLPKPIVKEQVLAVLRKLGFREKSKEDRRGSDEATDKVKTG